MSRCDLLSLQGKCKRDPEGYRDDVLMQLQHYNALHGLFMLKPGKDFKEFADLVGFLAQVAASYKRDIPAFHVGLVELLDKHYALLDPNLRRSLVGALILLHNRGSVTLGELLPLFFRLFRCPDKQLRLMIFRHIVSAVKSANKNKRDEGLNRSVQKLPPSGAQRRERSRREEGARGHHRPVPTQRVERRADRQPRRGRVSPSLAEDPRRRAQILPRARRGGGGGGGGGGRRLGRRGRKCTQDGRGDKGGNLLGSEQGGRVQGVQQRCDESKD